METCCELDSLIERFNELVSVGATKCDFWGYCGHAHKGKQYVVGKMITDTALYLNHRHQCERKSAVLRAGKYQKDTRKIEALLQELWIAAG